MTKEVQVAIATWREAVAEARAAEALLAHARSDYESRRGSAVSDVLVQEVAKARARANDKLSLALAMISAKKVAGPPGPVDDTGDSNHHQQEADSVFPPWRPAI